MMKEVLVVLFHAKLELPSQTLQSWFTSMSCFWRLPDKQGCSTMILAAMSGQPPALPFMCLRESQAKYKCRRNSERAKKICLSHLHLEAEVRDGWALLFSKKWHVYEGQVTDEPAISISWGGPVADASITTLQFLNFQTQHVRRWDRPLWSSRLLCISVPGELLCAGCCPWWNPLPKPKYCRVRKAKHLTLSKVCSVFHVKATGRVG